MAATRNDDLALRRVWSRLADLVPRAPRGVGRLRWPALMSAAALVAGAAMVALLLGPLLENVTRRWPSAISATLSKRPPRELAAPVAADTAPAVPALPAPAFEGLPDADPASPAGGAHHRPYWRQRGPDRPAQERRPCLSPGQGHAGDRCRPASLPQVWARAPRGCQTAARRDLQHRGRALCGRRRRHQVHPGRVQPPRDGRRSRGGGPDLEGRPDDPASGRRIVEGTQPGQPVALAALAPRCEARHRNGLRRMSRATARNRGHPRRPSTRTKTPWPPSRATTPPSAWTCSGGCQRAMGPAQRTRGSSSAGSCGTSFTSRARRS